MQTTIAQQQPIEHQRHTTADDDGYPEFLAAVRARFAALTDKGEPLFTTDATGLFDAFLAALPPADRQHYTCNACRRFVERFGGLVTVEPGGTRASVMWAPHEVPEFFRAPVAAMSRAAQKARITGVFVSSEPIYGLPVNTSKKEPYQWRHLSAVPAPARIFKATALRTAEQRAAEHTEEHGMLSRGLADYSIDVVRQAHTLLTGGNLYRSEKCIGVAAWLLALHEALATTKREDMRDALLWRAVATAPAGYCHVRTTMIATLLDDVAASFPFADIKARFDAKMAPLAYARPQAAPSAGNIAAAEKVIASLNAAGALARRFARVEEVDALWRPAAPVTPPAQSGGVFSHLLPSAQAPAQIVQPSITVTWTKFERDVLPGATKIEALVPHGRAGFCALVTAANPDAPPILQWDNAERRNPVSWYVYHNGSPASQWALTAGAWAPVSAVCYQPPMWHGGAERFTHHGKGVLFLIEGAWDTVHKQSGGLFVESLRSEFHAVRATLEAYMMRASVEGSARETATACGLVFQGAAARWTGATFRVTAKGGMTTTYTLDRWE